MAKFLKVALNEPRSVVAVYDEKPEYTDTDDFKIVAYNFDESTEERLSLVVAADGSVTNKHAGKTKAEAKALNEQEATQWRVDVAKAAKKRRIGFRTQEKLEAIDWKTQRAKEQDFLAGNTNKQDALAAEKKAIRDEGNTWEAGVDALTTFEQVEAYSSKPPNLGEARDWKNITMENS